MSDEAISESNEARDLVGEYQFGFHDEDKSVIRFNNGLSEQIVRDISAIKNEPEWMTDIRVKAYHHFVEREMPKWGSPEILNNIDFEAITYFLRPQMQPRMIGKMFLRIFKTHSTKLV